MSQKNKITVQDVLNQIEDGNTSVFEDSSDDDVDEITTLLQDQDIDDGDEPHRSCTQGIEYHWRRKKSDPPETLFSGLIEA